MRRSGGRHRARRTRVRVERVVEGRSVVGLRREVVARSAEVLQRADLVAQNPTDGADRRNVELVAHAVREQLVADLPREDARVFVLVHLDGLDDVGGRHARLAASDRARQDGARLVVSSQDLADAPVRHLALHITIRRCHQHIVSILRKQSAFYIISFLLKVLMIFAGLHVCVSPCTYGYT